MSKTKQEIKEEVKKNSFSIHKFGLYDDTINPIATLDFPDSDDRGFEFLTSNVSFVFRLNKHDYYNFIDTLFSDVYDDFQGSEKHSPLIDDFRDFLLAKMDGER